MTIVASNDINETVLLEVPPSLIALTVIALIVITVTATLQPRSFYDPLLYATEENTHTEDIVCEGFGF